MAQGLRAFHSLKEVDETLMQANRVAMKNTLDELKDDLYDFIAYDVYGTISANYNQEENFGTLKTYKWSGRSYSLLDPRTIEIYVYNAFGKGVGGGIRFNDQAYYQNSNIHNFVHGNEHFGELAFTSYLEVMNDSSKLKKNPYHFPTGEELHRRSFMEDFTRYANANFAEIYKKYLTMALDAISGAKPKIGEGNQNKTNAMNTKNLPEPRYTPNTSKQTYKIYRDGQEVVSYER